MSIKAGEDAADAAPPVFCLYQSSASQVFPHGNTAYSPLKKKKKKSAYWQVN